jgi:hypothetical protein
MLVIQSVQTLAKLDQGAFVIIKTRQAWIAGWTRSLSEARVQDSKLGVRVKVRVQPLTQLNKHKQGGKLD